MRGGGGRERESEGGGVRGPTVKDGWDIKGKGKKSGVILLR